ncbi:glutaredoxin family protein [Gordonia soli]|uniref:Glutaredoxin family protein n=1 Tax=Gordonia soli NBRC 108243 TaxID=1223545 RepID=M0QH99_9ACTN|nr:glutaredoxin family protein [Gordonia soli]GAC68010.1 hypothetical protein GS4_11_02820 [Gordonia soli NBRC 108243]
MALTLLTRANCSACAAAQRDLSRIAADHDIDVEILDVDAAAGAGDPTLRAEYGDRLPVVLLDGVEHSYWEVDEPRLRADLTARAAR